MPPTGGALGIAGGGQGGRQLSPFPISPGITYRKKTGKGKLEMFTKHTSHTSVPLTLWMPNRHIRSCSLPALRGAQGWRLPQHRPAPRGFFSLAFFGHHPRCIHPRAPARSLLSRGGLLLPPPSQALPAGLGALGSACLCSGGSGSVGDAGTHSLPSQMHFKAKLPFFSFSGAGTEQAGDAPVAPGAAGPSTSLQAPVPWHSPRGEALWKSWACPRCRKVHPLGIWGSQLHASSSGSSPGSPGSISSSPMGASLALQGSPDFLIPFS